MEVQPPRRCKHGWWPYAFRVRSSVHWDTMMILTCSKWYKTKPPSLTLWMRIATFFSECCLFLPLHEYCQIPNLQFAGSFQSLASSLDHILCLSHSSSATLISVVFLIPPSPKIFSSLEFLAPHGLRWLRLVRFPVDRIENNSISSRVVFFLAYMPPPLLNVGYPSVIWFDGAEEDDEKSFTKSGR